MIKKIIKKSISNILSQKNIYQKNSVKSLMRIQNNVNILDLSTLQQPNKEKIDAIVILDNVLNQKWLGKALPSCDNIIIADGGANKLFKTKYKQSNIIRSIIGNFNNINNQIAINQCAQKGFNQILCFGAFGGRMDRSMSNLSSTSKLYKQNDNLNITLIGRQNLMYLIKPYKKYKIRINKQVDLKGCGLIRFGHNVRIKTKGLKWDMGQGHQFWQIGWGSFVSTSNQFVDQQVQIQAQGQVYFVMHIQKHIDII